MKNFIKKLTDAGFQHDAKDPNHDFGHAWFGLAADESGKVTFTNGDKKVILERTKNTGTQDRHITFMIGKKEVLYSNTGSIPDDAFIKDYIASEETPTVAKRVIPAETQTSNPGGDTQSGTSTTVANPGGPGTVQTRVGGGTDTNSEGVKK